MDERGCQRAMVVVTFEPRRKHQYNVSVSVRVRLKVASKFLVGLSAVAAVVENDLEIMLKSRSNTYRVR